MKVAVYGAGAMGTLFGAVLSEYRKAEQVDLIGRNKEHIAALKERGAHIVCATQSRDFMIEVDALLPEEMTDRYDVIFLMTKQRDNAKIAEFLKEHLTDEGIVCTTQNGLPEESIAGIIGKDRTYGGIAAWGATFVEPGTVALTSDPGSMSIEIGCYAGKGKKTDELLKLLDEVNYFTNGVEFVRATENLMGSRWSKLAINAAFSGLSVLTGLTFGELAKKRESRKIALRILRECFDVAGAAGVTLEPLQGHNMKKLLGRKGFFGTQLAMFLLPIAMRGHRGLVSGMLKDLEKGRKCEIDYINGAVCRWGDKYGVETPLCDAVVEITHGIENGLYEISYRNVDFLKDLV